jgi:salicylate hydroxylase
MHHAGFDVVVFEKVREFLRLGDSLGLGENALKLLDRWSPSLRNRLVEIGNKSEFMQIRRWHDGKLLAQQPLMDMAGFIGHRGDYHRGFLDAVAEKGIPVHMGQEVNSSLRHFKKMAGRVD